MKSVVIVSGIIFLSLFLICITLSCGTQQEHAYKNEIEEWHKQRVERLSRPDGWLSLAGLFWLKNGENTFGSGQENDITFPKSAAEQMGVFILSGRQVTMRVNPGVKIFIDSSLVTETLIKSDQVEDTTIPAYNNLSWYVIERGERIGIRLKDTENPARLNFKGIDRFPVDKKWCVQAKFEIFDSLKTISIPSRAGTMSEETIPGVLHFEIKGKQLSLEPFGDFDSKRFFIVFADVTSGHETYGGGRFLYIDAPDSNGTTIVEFNKAYNPPCVFTEFATCPLPPSQNRLPIKIEAGEKAYAGTEH